MINLKGYSRICLPSFVPELFTCLLGNSQSEQTIVDVVYG